jgi:hypothetical protein
VPDRRRAARPSEPLPARREHALGRIDRERAEIVANWRSMTGIVRARERGALALAQGLVTALRIGGAAAAIWLAGRVRGPRFVRRGAMLLTAARAAGTLMARRHPPRGRRAQSRT